MLARVEAPTAEAAAKAAARTDVEVAEGGDGGTCAGITANIVERRFSVANAGCGCVAVSQCVAHFLPRVAKGQPATGGRAQGCVSIHCICTVYCTV